MGWEQRGNHSYYYRKERSGSSVRSVYVGRGEVAHMISSDYWLRRGFELACERAKLAHGITTAGRIIFHDLRRTFATRLRASNVHPYDISYLLGHRIDGVTITYARE